MILIAESGATKTDWCLTGAGKASRTVRTAGINVAVMSHDAVLAVLAEAVGLFGPFMDCEAVNEIHFYAAGLIAPEGMRVPPVAEGFDRALRSVFPNAETEYASDLIAAARAVCGHSAGIAAILGTGSNSCLFDGKKVVKNVHPAGFILGDEGGGARLGKIFMGDFLKGLVPEPVSSEFASAFNVDYLTVVQNVYRGASPSAYLGSFAPWIIERYDSCEYVRSLVDSNFRDFIERSLKQYDIEKYPVGVVGGFGYAHREILKKVAEPYGIRFSSIIAAPLEGLAAYHIEESSLGLKKN